MAAARVRRWLVGQENSCKIKRVQRSIDRVEAEKIPRKQQLMALDKCFRHYCSRELRDRSQGSGDFPRSLAMRRTSIPSIRSSEAFLNRRLAIYPPTVPSTIALIASRWQQKSSDIHLGANLLFPLTVCPMLADANLPLSCIPSTLRPSV